ncbi:hypothetical protein Pst134EA_032805 [Puccinia striiformis f. sp. tritici]|uniref:uncharacterized protein n=1 Tax=Puccinia striiformis f. sp. tritici TaxID=168172 RepID=UPI00200818A7|nr:uncharacterized protein Pst134EA_032805 [Puccinia striiformis f. sp. tritici]KAH9443508.1 hypothetical protein Pst134EA_032805 [Puccinia striiformis f. sp. tritici]
MDTNTRTVPVLKALEALAGKYGSRLQEAFNSKASEEKTVLTREEWTRELNSPMNL